MTGSRSFAAVPGGGGPAGTTVLVEGTGFVDTGNVTCDDDSWTALGPDVTITAAAGDILELTPDFLVDSTGNDMQLDAVTIVADDDTTFWSTGTGTSRYPGGLGAWYMPSGYRCPPPARYVVQAGDVVAGAVTVRLYGQVTSGLRNILATSSYPLRWWLTNLGPGT